MCSELIGLPITGSPPEKSSPGLQFTGKNPPRPAAARAARISTGKLSSGKTFLGWDRSYNEETYQFRNYLSPGAFFHGGYILM